MRAGPLNRSLRRPRLFRSGAAIAAALLVVASSCADGAPVEATGGPREYDVQAYDVVATVAIDGDDHLDAVATIVAVAETTLGSFDLDLVGLKVERVVVDGTVAEFTRPDDLLSVTPPTEIETGATFTTEVHYSGDPSQEGDPTEALEDGGGWLDLGDYSAVVAQPTGARTWLPSNDVPSDKASVSVDVEVPAPLVAASNGRLAEQRTVAPSTEGVTPGGTQDDELAGDEAAASNRFRWVADEPMAPYLITVAIGEFELRRRTNPGGIESIDAIPPGHDALVARIDRTDEMLTFLAERFGPYPFTTTGAIIVPGMPDTALETQTRPVYSVTALEDQDEGGQLVLHELAHQWFGDAVTPETWDGIWLNEGPAVYSQWLWWESQGGPSVLESASASWDPDDAALDVPPADPGDDERFGASVYERSAMFLVELRQLMGVEAFHELLRAWVDEHRYGTATTDEFVELAGRLHGESIEPLSDPWLYGDQLPPLTF